jgi:predicted ferric reductase
MTLSLFYCLLAHYGIVKYDTLKQTISEDEPYYQIQRAVPSIIYGSKHAMLLQMAAIPLTVSRLSIAALCDSPLAIYIPFKRTLRLHILYAYTMIWLLVFAMVGLIVFYARMCAVGLQDYCDRISSEIMMTGYAITVCTLIVGATSYMRHRIPYELFYALHHVVFILYLLTILHTLDMQYRHGRQRSQCFTWVSTTLLYYICDRVGARLNHTYRVRAISCSTVSGGSGKMVVLRLSRPTLFEFKPGQYVYLKIPEVDNNEWHPFSVASGSADHFIDFYIEVFDEQTWTHKLWKFLKHIDAPEDLIVEMMGPYGTSIAKTDEYSHALLIGTSTGMYALRFPWSTSYGFFQESLTVSSFKLKT